ncbi:MAG: FecR domain-containing protein [Bacteroidales bacterium]|nr:FecR domain-containing protein [Bacteroidales bacterium]
MISKNINNKTDAAWSKLHNRLESEGLLEVKSERNMIRAFANSTALRVAAALVILIGATLYLTVWNKGSETLLSVHNSEESSTVATTLEDGSTVFLAKNTTLSYPKHFDKERREVRLEGNAYFEISKNPAKPFIVETELITIEVLGTSFNVTVSDTPMPSIAVNTGRVSVTLKSNGQRVTLLAGESGVVSSGSLKSIPTEDFEQFRLYMNRIHFKDEKLSDVVRIINKNSPELTIELAPGIQERLITATFAGNSPDTMAQLICVALNLNYTVQQGKILIHE